MSIQTTDPKIVIDEHIPENLVDIPRRFQNLKGTFQWTLLVLKAIPSKELYMSMYSHRLNGECRFCVKGAVTMSVGGRLQDNGDLVNCDLYCESGLDEDALDWLEGEGFRYRNLEADKAGIRSRHTHPNTADRDPIIRKRTWSHMVKRIQEVLDNWTQFKKMWDKGDVETYEDGGVNDFLPLVLGKVKVAPVAERKVPTPRPGRKKVAKVTSSRRQ